LQQLLQNGLTVNAVHQQIIELVPDPFELGWVLFLEYQLHDILDLSLVRSQHSIRVFGVFGCLELDQGCSQVSITAFGDVVVGICVE
jgi:hypothetical protein